MSNARISNPESQRLYFKPMEMEHVTVKYLSWLNDPEINKYLEVKKENTMEALKEYVSDAVNKEIFFWAIHLKENGLHIGNIKIDPVDKKNGIGEYGILMGEKGEWRKGYAKEASMAIIDFCFTKMNLRKITLGVVENNIAAVNLYKHIGFVTEGNYRKHALYDGIYCNILRMAIFNPSYRY